MPSSMEQWLTIAERYETLWNFPQCLGALDGKHVVLQAPVHSGSEFYNYKSNFSIVLFALTDAEYNFIYANVGCQGRISDSGVFKHTQLYKQLQEKKLHLPPDSSLPERNKKVPYVIVGDEAFALAENLMKPFSGTYPKGSPQRIYNYRLSRARRTVENVFGITSARFRVLRKPMLLEPEKAELVVMAIVHLHNFLRRNQNSRNLYSPNGTYDHYISGRLVEGSWRGEVHGNMTSLLPMTKIPRKSGVIPQDIRNEFCEYFNHNGRLDWQDDYA